jgi:hypothetical protein
MKKVAMILFVVLFFSSCLFARLSTVTGKIKVTGNEPFTNLIIETADGKKYIVIGEKSVYLKNEKQNSIVKLKGKIKKEPDKIIFGSFEVMEFQNP